MSEDYTKNTQGLRCYGATNIVSNLHVNSLQTHFGVPELRTQPFYNLNMTANVNISNFLCYMDILLLLYLYSHIVIQLCSIKMVHVLVTMLITVKHYIQHKYLICAQIQYESINIITS